ncbi:hypothetical protein V6N13_072632 [Hibiscus sabdariffa]|uniref:Uncharacterized protein n=1 Tax=Hibiscus sabdariffa TaxID=183260 RepID=A0ABR2E6J7_9ROSI
MWHPLLEELGGGQFASPTVMDWIGYDINSSGVKEGEGVLVAVQVEAGMGYLILLLRLLRLKHLMDCIAFVDSQHYFNSTSKQ